MSDKPKVAGYLGPYGQIATQNQVNIHGWSHLDQPLILLTDHEAERADDKARIAQLEDRHTVIEQSLGLRIAELEQLAERLKQEAQIHAMEARTANATIAEIYQAVSGGKGEPGNWHGAVPVRECIGELLGLLREALGPVCEALNYAATERAEAIYREILERIDATLSKHSPQGKGGDT